MSLRILKKIVNKPSTVVRSLSYANIDRRNVEHGVPYKDSIKEKAVSAPQSVPKEADVVVIGGGSLGCSTLYHLVELGTTNVVLLEAHQLTSGTTWHTAGLVRQLSLSDTEIELLRRTRDVILTLQEETGVNPGWINCGGLYVTSNEKRLNVYKRLMTIGRVHNIESFLLDPNQTKELHPLLNVSDVFGALYVPGDGTVEPAGLCTALTRYATRRGAKVIEKCPVLDIRTESTLLGGTEVKEVVTPYGNIKTSKVVNATGSWGNYITSMVGINIPLVSMKHAYVVTQKIPGIENTPSLRDHDALLFIKRHGDSLSIGSFEMNPVILDKVEKDTPFGLFDLDWNAFSEHIEGAVNRIPILEQIGIKSTVCGPESFTPDHKPIMGEDPNVMGFYHCCGFNSAGMMLGGGAGNQMAQWVIKGRPELDMFAYDIRRFHPTLNNKKSWVVPRTHEAFAKSYSITFPHGEPLAGREQKKSPLHEILVENGCIFQERHGWERPGWFNHSPAPIQPYDWYGKYDHALSEDTRCKDALALDKTFDFPPHHYIIGNECLSTRAKATLFDMSYSGQLFMTGPDSEKAADWLFTSNIQKNTGSVINTCMLNEQGGIESNITVSILDDSNVCEWEPIFNKKSYYLVTDGVATLQNKAHIMKEIRKNKWDVDLMDYTDKMSILSLQGPKSRDILQGLTDVDLSNDFFPYLSHKIITVAGHRVRALRISSVGELGWELHTTVEAAIPIYNVLHKVGEKYKMMNGGYRALNSLSCEKGNVLWHADIRPDDTPIEAGLEFLCKLDTSTPFLGREAIANQKKQGPRKKLVVFILNDPSIAIHGLEGIIRNGKSVGFVRRAEYAYTLGTSIARGYVKMPCGGPVTEGFVCNGEWEIDVMGTKYSARLHPQ